LVFEKLRKNSGLFENSLLAQKSLIGFLSLAKLSIFIQRAFFEGKETQSKFLFESNLNATAV